MAEDTKAQTVPVNETPAAPMPSAEQQTTEPNVSQTSVTEDGLPTEASERTKHEFDKLQGQLREERQRREAAESAFKSLQPKKEVSMPALYDPNTGYLNEQALTDVQKRAYEAEQRAIRAEESIQGYHAETERREAYAVYPDADPNNTKMFNPELKKKAAAVILHSMVNPQEYNGKMLSLKEAYDYVKGTDNTAVDKARKEGAQEAIEQLSPKEQAALEATGTSMRRNDIADTLVSLRSQTRKGNQDAIVRRLQGLKTQA